MGMYTELHYNVELERDVPQQVIDVLSFMAGGREDEPALPEHQLFSTQRWRHVLTLDSYSFPAKSRTDLFYDDIAQRWFLNVRSNLKNYDREIQEFVDWLDPYVHAWPGDFLGFYRYEESEDPTLIRKRHEGSRVSPPFGERAS